MLELCVTGRTLESGEFETFGEKFYFPGSFHPGTIDGWIEQNLGDEGLTQPEDRGLVYLVGKTECAEEGIRTPVQLYSVDSRIIDQELERFIKIVEQNPSGDYGDKRY